MKKRRRRKAAAPPAAVSIRLDPIDARRLEQLTQDAGGTIEQAAALMIAIGLAAVAQQHDSVAAHVAFVERAKDAHALEAEAEKKAAAARQIRTGARKRLAQDLGVKEVPDDRADATAAGVLSDALSLSDHPATPPAEPPAPARRRRRKTKEAAP